MICSVHHVQITIPKGAEEKAKQFYCGILGLNEKEKPDSLKRRGGFWLEAGKIDIHVGIEDGVDRYKTKAHIAYEVDNLAYWRNKLEKNQIKITEAIPIPKYDRLEFRNPFGNRVEMIQAL